MPLYEYECEHGHRYEVIQGIKELPQTTCTTCAGKVHRVIYPAGIDLRGTGWTPKGF